MINDFFYCPHFIESNIKKYKVKCKCRKPEIGMIQISKKWQIDLKQSFMIGDKKSDKECASKAGLNFL